MKFFAITLLLSFASCVLAEKLVFSEEFDELDLSKWEHEITAGGGGNWEFEYYTNNRSNSYVKDSVLYIRPTLTADTIGEANLYSGYTLSLWGSSPGNLCTGNAFYGCERVAGAGGNVINPIQSARLRSTRSMNFKYGRLEVRAKLPVGDWLWPAIWMVPSHDAYGGWPASGEIDLVESRGNLNYPAGGPESFGSTLHWGPYYLEDPYSKTHATTSLPEGQTFNDEFHVFGMKWDEKGLYTYLDTDDNRVLDVTFDEDFWTKGGWGDMYNNPWQGRNNSAPFDQPFYLVMNVAVGGTNSYFPDGVGGKPWANTQSNAVNNFYAAKSSWYPTWDPINSTMRIDSVKLWQ